MYKVFFNGSTIHFCSKNEVTLGNRSSEIIEIEDGSLMFKWIEEIETTTLSRHLFFINTNIEELWKTFRSHLKEITAAGGIVRDNSGRVLTIRRFDKWDIPKGKVEENEQIEEAAVREVEEECGISGVKITRKIGSKFHVYRSPYHSTPKPLLLKETHWFEMIYTGNEIPVPQTKEGIEEVRWMNTDDLNDFFNDTYPNLVELMKEYLQIP